MTEPALRVQQKLRSVLKLAGRTLLGRSQVGTSHDGHRNIYELVGYPDSISLKMLDDMYSREDIASRIVDAPAEETWRMEPRVFEDEDPQNETPFEKDWKSIRKRLKVFHYFHRVDRLAGIGHYGVLFIGLKDGQSNLALPVENVSSPEQVIYLQPLRESHATVVQYEQGYSEPQIQPAENV